jgi:hypothetical protein
MCPLAARPFVVQANGTLRETKEAPVKYALLIYPGDSVAAAERLSEEEQRAVTGEYLALREEPGVFGGARLQPAESATTVHGEDGRTLTTDGPFANTTEILGGLYLLEADDLDAALDVAARIPAVRMGGAVEVRPIWEAQ